MLQDMDHMEASCVCYVKVGMLNRLELSTICVLTVSTLGITILTIQHYMMCSVCFMWDPRDFLRQISPDVLSIEECGVYISQTCEFGGGSHLVIPVNLHTTSDWLGTNHRMVRILCNLKLYAAGFVLSRMCKSAVTHFSLTLSYLYIAQDFPLLVIIIFLRTSQFFSLSSSSSFPHQQMMAPQTTLQSTSRSESSRTVGASSNTPIRSDTTTMHASVSRLRRCQSSHWN